MEKGTLTHRASILKPCRDHQQWTIHNPHHIIIQFCILFTRHPPFERDNQTEYLYKVKWSNEDVLVRCADELHCFLTVESHVFVDCIFGDVFVRGVVEGDEDVEQDDHDKESEDVVKDYAEGRGEVIEIGEVGGLHYCVCHCLDDECCGLGIVR